MSALKWLTTFGAIAFTILSFTVKAMAKRRWSKGNEEGTCAACGQLLAIHVKRESDDMYVICRNCAQGYSDKDKYLNLTTIIVLGVLLFICLKYIFGWDYEWKDLLGFMVIMATFLGLYFTYISGPGKDATISEGEYHIIERRTKKKRTGEIVLEK